MMFNSVNPKWFGLATAALLLFGSPSSLAQTQADGSLHWTTFSQGLEQAKAEDKLVLADVYTDWCGWCKRMDKTTFLDPTLQSYLNSKFVVVKCNAEDRSEGQRVAEANGIYSYPNTLVFNAEGKVIGKIPGFMTADKYQEHLQKILKKAHR